MPRKMTNQRFVPPLTPEQHVRLLGERGDKIEQLNTQRLKINEAIDKAGFFLLEHIDGTFTLNRK